jgi:hypothetical protein
MAQGSSNPTSNLTKVKNTTVDVNKGNAGAGTQRVVLATDQPTLSVNLSGGSGNLGNVNINQVYAEDVAATTGDSLFVAGAVREDTLSSNTNASGDYTWLKTNNLGRLYTSSAIDTSLPVGTNIVGKTYITDGTRDASVKAASTAALATDTSLVTAFSPNSPLPTGSNAIGKLTTNDGVDIGDVTVNNAIGSGVYVRLTDGTNTMPTGDAASRGVYNRITDGTNTAAVKAASTAAAGTDPALVVSVSPNTEVKLAAGSNNIGDVDVLTLPSLPAGTNNIGDVDVLTLPSIPTGSNTIGKVDINQVYTEDTASTGGESLHLIGAVRQDTLANAVSADGDYAYFKVNSTGRLYTTATIDAAIPTGTNIIGKIGLVGGATNIDISARTGSNAIASITNIQIVGTGGQFQCSNPGSTLVVGQLVTLSGTVPSGAVQGTITGYANPTTYRISATNGSTNFTLIDANTYAALVTVAGSGASGLFGTAAALDASLVTSIRDPLPSGNNIIGRLGANSGVNIGTVDIANTSLTISGNISTITSITTANLASDHQHNGNMATNDKMVMTGGYASAGAPSAIPDGKAARFWTTPNGALNVASPVNGPLHVRLSDGTNAITTLPVSLASVPSHPVTNAGTFPVQVDGAALTALQLLDDVVATDGNTALTKLYQVGGTDGTNAQIISTTTAGHVNIADGSGSLTVDAPVGTPVFVRLSDGTNAITTLPVSLASVPSHPVTNAGTFLVQENGSALTALQLLDDVVATDGNTALTKLYQVGGTDGTNAQIISTTTAGHVNIADGGNTISVDDGGSTISVDDGGGSLTVDGGVNINSLSTLMNNNTTTTAYAASLVVKATAGNLYMLTGYNSKASGQFIQLHNVTSVPSLNAVPVITFYVAAQSNFSFDFGTYGRHFSNGIVVCNSSTGPTLTIGSNDCWFDAQHK